MSSGEPAVRMRTRFQFATLMRPTQRRWRSVAAAGITILALAAGAAQAANVRSGIAALDRQDYTRASLIFFPLAERGEPQAQAYLGYMYQTGRGVPQNYTEAAYWYRRSAEQGYGPAQYWLGLLYDKGQGVPRDIVEASKWLNLSTASANGPDRGPRMRMRDAVTTKMTRGEIAQARLRAVQWAPSVEVAEEVVVVRRPIAARRAPLPQLK